MQKKLPQTKVEIIIFLLVVSFISVNLIGPVISFFETSISVQNYLHTLQSLPYVWITVILVVLVCEGLTHKLAIKLGVFDLKTKFVLQIVILMNVFFISFFMTIFGTWIAMRDISLIPFQTLLIKWPRNLIIAALVEILIAQPIAHQIMIRMHKKSSN